MLVKTGRRVDEPFLYTTQMEIPNALLVMLECASYWLLWVHSVLSRKVSFYL